MNTKLWLTKWKNLLVQSGSRRKNRKSQPVRRYAPEALEVRTLLAAPTDLGQIEGTTFQDSNNNGTQDVGEPALTPVT